MRRLRGDRRAVSALFDAIIFFIILLVASGAIHLSASLSKSQEAVEVSSARSARLAREILACALECTVGPVNCTLSGQEPVLEGTVLEALLILREGGPQGPGEGDGNLEAAVREVCSLLTPDSYHFALQATSAGVDFLFISDSAASLSGVPHPRSACSAPLELEGEGASVTLYIWR